jgi:cell division protein FtsI/penicillin-binding protein 2
MARATKYDDIVRKRVVILTALLVLGLGAILTRLAYLQIWENGNFRVQAADQHTGERALEPVRGEIRVTNQKDGQTDIVATSVAKPLVYAVPPLVTDAGKTALALAPILQMPVEDLLPKLSDTSRRYVPLKKQLTDEQRQKIADLKLAGINFDTETVRYYPEGDFLSHVLGYVGYKGDEKVGLYGIEGALQDELAGQGGYLAQERDASGTWIFGTKRDFRPAQDGETVVLTIDKTIQYKAEQVLKTAVDNNQADSGSVVIANPKTGAIIAMAAFPSFDPNNFGTVKDPAVFNNQVTLGSYEPGSIMKPLVMAAAINENLVGPQSTYTDLGQVVVDGYTIKNSDLKAHGVQTMTEVLEKSLNTGMIYVREQLGNARLK